jgi:hypothetical protein
MRETRIQTFEVTLPEIQAMRRQPSAGWSQNLQKS